MEAKEFADYILNKTIKRISIAVKELPVPKSFIVYMALSKKAVLYVGMSTCGLKRPFDPEHHILRGHWGEIVTLEVYEVGTKKEAAQLEAALIQEFKPKYNARLDWGKRQRKPGASAIIARYSEQGPIAAHPHKQDRQDGPWPAGWEPLYCPMGAV